MPTKRRRHAITETPPVQAALDELRRELGHDRVEMGELVVLLSPDRSVAIADAVESGLIGVCLPFLLEAGYSARSAREHDDLLTELLSLPGFEIDDAVEQRALDAQRQLAWIGHHRLPPVDLLIAAIADRQRLGVLHYDRGYDVLVERTDLTFESTWLAPAGSL